METAVIVGVITAVIGGFTGLVTVFLKFIKALQSSQNKRDDAFAKSLEANTKAMNKVAEATKRSADEAEKRNGHLAELAIENKESTLKAIAMIQQSNVQHQHVEAQVIDTQIIEQKETTDGSETNTK